MFSEQCPTFASLVTGTSEGLPSQYDSCLSIWNSTMRIGGDCGDPVEYHLGNHFGGAVVLFWALHGANEIMILLDLGLTSENLIQD